MGWAALGYTARLIFHLAEGHFDLTFRQRKADSFSGEANNVERPFSIASEQRRALLLLQRPIARERQEARKEPPGNTGELQQTRRNKRQQPAGRAAAPSFLPA